MRVQLAVGISFILFFSHVLSHSPHQSPRGGQFWEHGEIFSDRILDTVFLSSPSSDMTEMTVQAIPAIITLEDAFQNRSHEPAGPVGYRTLPGADEP